MFKIMYCTDLHGSEKLYDKLVSYANKHKEIAAVVIGGDLCPHTSGKIDDAVRQQKEFILNVMIPKLKGCSKDIFLMMGNDDFKANLSILESEEKKGTFRLLDEKPKKIGNKKIIGYSYVSETPFLLKDWEKLDNDDSKQMTDPKQDIRTVPKEKGTVEQDMKKLGKADIYAIHCPPFQTDLDMLPNRQNVGSRSVKSFIEEKQPLLTLHGHIHESVIASGEFMERIGTTFCVNPGSDYLEGILDAAIIDLDDPENMEHEMI